MIILATWVAGKIAESQERDTLDTRLAANLRVGREEFADALADAEAKAERIAASTQVQRALADGNAEAAAQIAATEGDIGLLADGELLAGEDSWAASRTVDVVDDEGETVGSVVVGVPLDDELADRLARAAGLLEMDVLAIADGGETLAASGALSPGAPLPAGRAGDDGAERRELPLRLDAAARRHRRQPGRSLLGGSCRRRRRRHAAPRLLRRAGHGRASRSSSSEWSPGCSGAAAAEAQAAQEEADQRRRSRDVRRGGDEQRVREAVALVGEALAATHDPEALLPVILQSAIEATGAAGARLVSGGTEVVRAGRPEEGGGPLSLRLGTDEDGIGRLLLYPPKDGSFDEESEQLAHWLAAQASIAIENERLHRTVKRQAITDELTQLANRRRFTETLAVEVRRAERFGDPLALVLADLDDFKQINDRYGHQTGDEVLRRFSDVLRENVRDFDLPVRYGGEEFAVLLPETGLDGAEQLARRLQSALLHLRLPETGGDKPPVTASFGVAAFPAARSAEELLSAADGALYRAKAAGKNRVASA